ncbi:MAG TPA: helix-turn-helix domain-containing protein [Longimicrobium sp.]
MQPSSPESRAELIFHPVRMRILQALLRMGKLTPGELGKTLADVPPATLYRHLNRLAAGGIVQAVEERPVRGVVERVYAVSLAGASLGPDELAHAGREDHIRYFTVFLAGLLDDFQRYLDAPSADFARDGAGYRQIPLYLSDEELAGFTAELNRVIQGALLNEPRPGRRRRVLTRIILPSPEHDTDERDDDRRP